MNGARRILKFLLFLFFALILLGLAGAGTYVLMG